MSISITPSPFGSVTITLDGELGGVLSADILATSNSALNLDLGVPGPQGEAGATGPAGENGVGVPVGGTAGQVLAKIDSTDYNTEWVNVSSGDYLPLTGGTLSGSLSLSGASEDVSLSIQGGSDNTFSFGSEYGLQLRNNNYGLDFSADIGLYVVTYNNSPGIWLNGSGNGIKFPDYSIQSTAFPPSGGTSSQYIDGTGALQTFPTVTTAGKMVTSVRNNSGSTITKGTVVYINGAVGNKPTIAKAQANTEATSKATYGFVEANIANNADGNIVILGLLENIDTQGYSDGDLLFLSPTTAGAFTKTQPFSPYHYVRVGTVIRGGHPTLGSIAVQVTNGFQLDEMSDVGSTAPSNGNVLTWNSATSQWLDKSIATILGYTPADNVLSNLSSSSTARTNLGLDTMATQSTSAYLSSSAISSTYLTQSSASSTYQTQSGMSAYLSTSAASSTYIAKTSYATTSEAEAMTSTTAVVSPARFRDAYLSANVTIPNTSTWLTGTSGTGGLNDSGTWDNRRVQGPTSAANTYVRCDHGTNQSRGRYYTNNIDWTKYNALYCRIAQSALNPDTNSIFRAVLGEAQGVNSGDPTVRSIGVRFNGQGALKILAHNGTTLTTYTTSYTPSQSVSFDLYLVTDGSGTVEAFVNGTSVGSTTGGPTTLLSGTAAQNCINFRVENNSTPSGTQISTIISGIKAYTS